MSEREGESGWVGGRESGWEEGESGWEGGGEWMGGRGEWVGGRERVDGREGGE